MKPLLTTAIIAACSTSAFAQGNTTTKNQDVKVSTNADGSGRATITIEANGKKEVRVVDLNSPNNSVVSVASTASSGQAPGVWLGVAADELSEELAAQLPVKEGTGVIIRHVAENSPAAKVGVQKNDILLKMDDQVITDGRQLQKLVRAKKVGDVVELSILRKGQEQKYKATLEQSTQSDWGGDVPEHPVIDVGSGKVAVQDILKNYAAAAGAAGGRANIVITSPDGKVITNLDTGDIKIAPLIKKADEAVNDVVVQDVLKKLESAINELRSNSERAGAEVAKAVKQAEEAARRAAEAARRAQEQVEREQKKQESKPAGQ